MTGLKQRLGAAFAIGGVSVASLLAGGILLGAASASQGSNGVTPTAGVSYRFTSDGVSACLVTFNAGPQGDAAVVGEPAAGTKIEVGRSVDANGEVKAWKLVDGQLVAGELPAGGPPPGAQTIQLASGSGQPDSSLQVIKSKPTSPEEVERLKAVGKIELTSEDCGFVDPGTLPEGKRDLVNKASLPTN